MSIKDLATLKAPLVDSENASNAEVIAFCKFVRDSSIRTEQDLVSSHGIRVVRYPPGSLGNDVYLLAEQVLIACLDTHKFYDAEYCLKYLEKRFGEKSTRVLRLRGMLLEFQGQATADKDCLLAATVVYQSILQKEPTDMLTLKRQISIAKSQGLRDQTIRLLTEYLHLFGSDFEAWLELGAIYLENGMYTSAAFCFEELITIQPQNYHVYVRYGEILVTLGGLDNLITARKQFTFSLELSKVNNLRAWWGIISTTQGITTAKGVSPKNNSLSVDLYDVAAAEISKASKDTRNFAYIRSSLETLAPSAAARTSSETYKVSAKDAAPETPAAVAVSTPTPAIAAPSAAPQHRGPGKKK